MNWFRSFWKALTTALGVGPTEPIHNFTPQAQQALALARKEAERLKHNCVGTEHLLLGLIRLGQSNAVTVLMGLELDLNVVRLEVEKVVGVDPSQRWSGNIPYTPRVKKVLALAIKEARALNHSYVGTEHILLGLLREGDGVAARVLNKLRVDTDKARQEILRRLGPPGASRKPKSPEGLQNAGAPKSQPHAVDTSKQRVTVIDGPLPPGTWERADMEPQLVTAPDHLAVRDELMRREPLFHRAEFGTTREDFEKMTAPEFWETSASGRRFSRQFVLSVLEKRYENPTEDVWEVGDFHCVEIAADNYLVTYTLHQGQRVTRRATIWRRTAGGWQIVYHQGTVVAQS